ncbi:MAG: dihydroorotate dehydrogenase electron transfer subunit [Brevefilum sp.]
MAGGFAVRTISSIDKLNHNTIWLTFEGSLEAQPGQFVMAWLPGIGEKPFSVASLDPFALLVVDVGPFSHAMHQLSAGDQVWIKGPLGHGYELAGDRLLLVGGGYGSAPLLALAKAARGLDKHVVVCLGAQSAQGVLLSEDFKALGCQASIATDDGTWGEKGLVTKIVEKAIHQSGFDALYACGPTAMLSALANICQSHQLDYQLSWEAYMRCGMGLCGSCEVPRSFDPALPVGWLACYDGPVFFHRWTSSFK